MWDLTKDTLNSCGQTSTKRIHLTQPRISLHQRLHYATTMDASEGAIGGCYKTIGLSVSHRTHWTTPRRNAPKLKRSVSQSSLACICGTSTLMEYTISQYIQIINRSRQFSWSIILTKSFSLHLTRVPTTPQHNVLCQKDSRSLVEGNIAERRPRSLA